MNNLNQTMSNNLNFTQTYSNPSEIDQDPQSIQMQEVQQLNIAFNQEAKSEKKVQKPNNIFPQQELIPSTKNPVVSPQQNAYKRMQDFLNEKKDYRNFPKISYEDFIMIDNLEENTEEDPMYKSLLKGHLDISFMYQFMVLLHQQRLNSAMYPVSVYQIIPDLTYYRSYVNDYIKNSCNLQNNLVICFKKERWNLLIFCPNKCAIYLYYLDDPNKFQKGEIAVLIDEIKRYIFPGVAFHNYYDTDKSMISSQEAAIMPLIIMDYFSRNANLIPMESTEIYYYGFLFINEVLKKKLFTW